jgi:hypothetical protein
MCHLHVADALWRWLSQQEDKEVPSVSQSGKTPRFTVIKSNARAQHHRRSSLSYLLLLWYCHILSLCEFALLEANDRYFRSREDVTTLLSTVCDCLRLTYSAICLSNDDPACQPL